jgi:hypothetical protein
VSLLCYLYPANIADGTLGMNIGISGCRNDEARDVTGLSIACGTENKGLRGEGRKRPG